MVRDREKQPEFREELERLLANRSKEDRKILLVGLLNRSLPPRSPAVLVGGALVEFLTSGAYVTGDVDLVGTRSLVRDLLLSAGFQESGRYFFREDIGLAVEVPSSSLQPTENVVEFEFEGFRIPTVSMEDALVDRLLAAKYWNSPTDWEQALLIYGAKKSQIDSETLRRKAEANEVLDWVERVEKEMGTSKARKGKD